MSRFRYIFLAVVLVATMLAETNQIALAEDGIVVIDVVKRDTKSTAINNIATDMITTSDTNPTSPNPNPTFILFAVTSGFEYREVPPEDKNPIAWVDPPEILKWSMWRIARWKPMIDAELAKHDYEYVTSMLVLGIIAQETQGDPNAECNPFDTERGHCAVGLMAIAVESWTGTREQLMNNTYNIAVGVHRINTVIGQAIEHGFRPGREATAAALAAYNCGWKSLLADRCFSFGGWMYAWKVLNYWTPLLENYLVELK